MVDTNPEQIAEYELIAEAVDAFGPLGEDHIGQKIGDLGLALDTFFMNGAHDQEGGTVHWGLGHRFRVNRWVMWTDNQGFHSIEAFDTPEDAEQAMHAYDASDAEFEEEED